jgi:uncharacterized membrane protein
LLNPAVQFNDILGFHPDHLVLPLLLWAFYFLEVNKFLYMCLSLVLIITLGEAWIPLIFSFGIYIIIQKNKFFLGLTVTFISFALFLFLILYLHQDFLHMGPGLQVIAKPDTAYSFALTGNLFKVFLTFFDLKKIFFFFFLLLPLLFLPLYYLPVLVVGIPEVFKILTSSEMLHYSVEGHYTLGLIGVFFVGYIYALRKLMNICVNKITYQLPFVTLIVTISMCIAHSPLPISFNFWSSWSGGSFNYHNYIATSETYSLRSLGKFIEYDSYDKFFISNGSFIPWMATLKNPIGLFPNNGWKESNYIILDKNRFKGSGSELGQLEYLRRFMIERDYLSTHFILIFSDKNYELWKASVN